MSLCLEIIVYVLICSRFCVVFTETSITFSYGVYFRRMTTQNFQKKHAHLNVFTKNQGRAASLPCPIGSFAPKVMLSLYLAMSWVVILLLYVFTFVGDVVVSWSSPSWRSMFFVFDRLCLNFHFSHLYCISLYFDYMSIRLLPCCNL
jgi:hypothetical protein